jgi:hypothetical protein
VVLIVPVALPPFADGGGDPPHASNRPNGKDTNHQRSLKQIMVLNSSHEFGIRARCIRRNEPTTSHFSTTSHF